MTLDEFNSSIATPPPTAAPKNAGSMMSASQMMLNAFHGLGSVATGAAKEAIAGPIQLGADIEGDLDKAASSIPGVKANTASGAQAMATQPGLTPSGGAEKAGAVIGDIAEGAVGPGDVEAAPDAIKAGVQALKDSDKNPVVQAIEKMGKDAAGGVKKAVGGDKVDPVESDLMPRLTPKEAEAAKKTNPQGFMGNIKRIAGDATKKAAATVKAMVPGFDKLGTFTEKANAVRGALSTEAENLKSQIADSDHPVPKREVVSAINSTEIPELIKTGDAAVRRMGNAIRKKAASIIAEQPGTVGGQLAGRKAFDDYVKKEIPNLYDNPGITAYRQLVSNIRDAWNGKIAEEAPEGVDYLGSLGKQSDLFDAEDVLNEKAARGEPQSQGEIGTNRFQRYADAHPGQAKAAKAAGGLILTGISAGEAVKNL